MTGNPLNILGTVAGGGTGGTSLLWFAPLGTAAPAAVAYTAEIQTITLTGTPTGGTFTPTWQGISAGPQTEAITATALATALNTAWSSLLNGGAITVALAGAVYTVTFPAPLGNVPSMTVTSALTGGTTPSAAVATGTPGAGANPATAAIPAGFNDAGICDASTGVSIKYADTTKEIDGFGLSSAARILFTKSVLTLDFTFLETTHTTLEIYHRLPIGATGVAGADGFISGVVDGPPIIQQYTGIMDVVDGNNRLRAYFPVLQNTSKGEMALPYGDAVTRPLTMTAFPDSSNNSAYWYPVVKNLAGV